MQKLKVRDVMTADVFALTADDSLATLVDAMDARNIRHVPVVNEDGDLVGLVSQRDLVRGALGDAADLPFNIARDLLADTKVGTLMTLEPETVEPNDALATAGQLLLDYKFGCLPVVEGDHLVGILTESDFVKLVVEQQQS